MSGLLGWPPETFWASTLPELYFAMRGWQRSQGHDPDENKIPAAPMTRGEMQELMDRLDG